VRRDDQVGLVPVTSSESGGDRDSRFAVEAGGYDEPWADPTVDGLVRALVGKGWVATRALVGPGVDPVDEVQVSHRSAAAARKADQRQRQQEKGWRQINLVAPDNERARAFLTAAAREIMDESLLEALSLALEQPKLVGVGAKVAALKGEVRDRVRGLIGL